MISAVSEVCGALLTNSFFAMAHQLFKFTSAPQAAGWRALLRRQWHNVAFQDALSVTLTVCLPVWLLFAAGRPHYALPVGLGALLVSLADIPGPSVKKLRIVVQGIFLLTTIAASTAFLLPYHSPMFFLIALLCLILCLFPVFGDRAGILGTTGIVMMIFTIGLHPLNPLSFACCIAAGGMLHLAASMMITGLFPHRYAKAAVAAYIMEAAAYLLSRADFYDLGVPLEVCRNKSLAIHHDVLLAREKITAFISDKNWCRQETAQRLLALSDEVSGLHMQVLAIHFDHRLFRELFAGNEIPVLVRELINRIYCELIVAAKSLQEGKSYRPDRAGIRSIAAAQHHLKKCADSLTGQRQQFCRKINTDFQDIIHHIKLAGHALNGAAPEPVTLAFSSAKAGPFTTVAGIRLLHQQVRDRSALFRHALRVAIVCTALYGATVIFPFGHYSYWVMLTSIFVIRPFFWLTARRNLERIAGTMGGIVAAVIILHFIKMPALICLLIGLFLFGYLRFLTVSYTVSVICITVIVITGLNLMPGFPQTQLSERLVDTLAGCFVSLSAAWLFPLWERHRLRSALQAVMKTNLEYIRLLGGIRQLATTKHRVWAEMRQQTFTASGKLAEMVTRIEREPRKTAGLAEATRDFIQLSHQLTAAATSGFNTLLLQHGPEDLSDDYSCIQKVIGVLDSTYLELCGSHSKDLGTEGDCCESASTGQTPDAANQLLLRISCSLQLQARTVISCL